MTSQTATGAGAAAGVMLRASTDPGAPFYDAVVSPGGTVTVQDRAAQGGAAATWPRPRRRRARPTCG